MLSSRALLATLLVVYVIAVLAIRWLALGVFALDRLTISAMLAVPVAQAMILIVWRRWFARRHS